MIPSSKQLRLVPCLVLVALFGAACSAGKKIDHVAVVKQELAAEAREGASIRLTVSSSNPEWETERERVATRLAAALQEPHAFRVVRGPGVAGEGDADLEVRILVADVRRVSADDRTRWGNAAGQARVVLGVEVLDAAGEVLGVASFGGLGYGGLHGATTEDALEEAVRRVVEYLAPSN